MTDLCKTTYKPIDEELIESTNQILSNFIQKLSDNTHMLTIQHQNAFLNEIDPLSVQAITSQFFKLKENLPDAIVEKNNDIIIYNTFNIVLKEKLIQELMKFNDQGQLKSLNKIIEFQKFRIREREQLKKQFQYQIVLSCVYRLIPSDISKELDNKIKIQVSKKIQFYTNQQIDISNDYQLVSINNQINYELPNELMQTQHDYHEKFKNKNYTSSEFIIKQQYFRNILYQDSKQEQYIECLDNIFLNQKQNYQDIQENDINFQINIDLIQDCFKIINKLNIWDRQECKIVLNIFDAEFGKLFNQVKDTQFKSKIEGVNMIKLNNLIKLIQFSKQLLVNNTDQIRLIRIDSIHQEFNDLLLSIIEDNFEQILKKLNQQSLPDSGKLVNQIAKQFILELKHNKNKTMQLKTTGFINRNDDLSLYFNKETSNQDGHIMQISLRRMKHIILFFEYDIDKQFCQNQIQDEFNHILDSILSNIDNLDDVSIKILCDIVHIAMYLHLSQDRNGNNVSFVHEWVRMIIYLFETCNIQSNDAIKIIHKFESGVKVMNNPIVLFEYILKTRCFIEDLMSTNNSINNNLIICEDIISTYKQNACFGNVLQIFRIENEYLINRGQLTKSQLLDLNQCNLTDFYQSLNSQLKSLQNFIDDCYDSPKLTKLSKNFINILKYFTNSFSQQIKVLLDIAQINGIFNPEFDSFIQYEYTSTIIANIIIKLQFNTKIQDNQDQQWKYFKEITNQYKTKLSYSLKKQFPYQCHSVSEFNDAFTIQRKSTEKYQQFLSVFYDSENNHRQIDQSNKNEESLISMIDDMRQYISVEESGFFQSAYPNLSQRDQPQSPFTDAFNKLNIQNPILDRNEQVIDPMFIEMQKNLKIDLLQSAMKGDLNGIKNNVKAMETLDKVQQSNSSNNVNYYPVIGNQQLIDSKVQNMLSDNKYTDNSLKEIKSPHQLKVNNEQSTLRVHSPFKQIINHTSNKSQSEISFNKSINESKQLTPSNIKNLASQGSKITNSINEPELVEHSLLNRQSLSSNMTFSNPNQFETPSYQKLSYQTNDISDVLTEDPRNKVEYDNLSGLKSVTKGKLMKNSSATKQDSTALSPNIKNMTKMRLQATVLGIDRGIAVEKLVKNVNTDLICSLVDECYDKQELREDKINVEVLQSVQENEWKFVKADEQLEDLSAFREVNIVAEFNLKAND